MVEASLLDIYLAMAANVKAVIPTRKLKLKGLDSPDVAGEEDWLQFQMLYTGNIATQRIQRYQVYTFELICYSLCAAFRKSEKPTFTGHIEAADLYVPIFNQRDYVIKNSCLRLQECKISFLDLSTSTFTAKSISTGTTPPLQTQSCVILTDATIIQTRN